MKKQLIIALKVIACVFFAFLMVFGIVNLVVTENKKDKEFANLKLQEIAEEYLASCKINPKGDVKIADEQGKYELSGMHYVMCDDYETYTLETYSLQVKDKEVAKEIKKLYSYYIE